MGCPGQELLRLARQCPQLSEAESRRLIGLAQAGDKAAETAVVRGNMRLVISIAAQMTSDQDLMQDLVSAGCIGLMSAVYKFDLRRETAPGKSIKLSSYVIWWLKKEMLPLLPSIGLTVPKALRYESKRAKSTKRAVDAAKAALSMRRIDLDKVQEPDGSEDYVDTRTRLQLRREIEDWMALDGLTERDMYIVRLRMLSDEPLTLSELAGRFGVSRERVRQLEGDLRGRLRSWMEDAGVERTDLPEVVS